MSTDYESIVNLLRLLPEPAVAEVADFAGYLVRKHGRLAVDEQAARRKVTAWPVPHYRQLNDGYCLPACVQMVLAYWNIERRQQALARQLHMIPDAGTPASHIRLLSSDVLQVTYREGTLTDLRRALMQSAPPILLVHTGELPYWNVATAHAVVLLEPTDNSAMLNDPGVDEAPIEVRLGDLQLAWDRMANLYATIRPN